MRIIMRWLSMLSARKCTASLTRIPVPGTVHGAEDDMVRKRRSRLQHIENLLRAEDDRQAMIFLEAGNELNGPITFQSDGVEEPERADCDDSGSNRHLPLLG